MIELREMTNSVGRYELLIDWIEEDDTRKTSWEPFDRINNDVPNLVEEFFKSKVSSLTYADVCQSEINAASGRRVFHRGRGFSYMGVAPWQRGGRGRRGESDSERGGFRGRGFHQANPFRGRAKLYVEQYGGTSEFDKKKLSRLMRSDAADNFLRRT